MGFLVRIALKTTICGGILYYTVREGVWSNQDDAVKVYTKVYNAAAPYVKKNVPQEVVQEVDKLPSAGDLKHFMVGYYNKGVIASMRFISNLPTHVVNGTTSLSEAVKKLMNEEK